MSFTFGGDIVEKFLRRHDLGLICRAHHVSPPTTTFIMDDLKGIGAREITYIGFRGREKKQLMVGVRARLALKKPH